ncbi:MAG: glycosyltransferase family 2 protein [Pseudorhodoferax sp.]
MATYNGAEYLGEFLLSLQQQSFQDFHLFVRDDGSSDATLNIVREHGRMLPITVLPTSDRLGPAASFLQLLHSAGGDFSYYFFADQDDCWVPQKLAWAVECLGPGVESVAVYSSRVEYVSQCLEHIKYSRVPVRIAFENALVENIATGCTLALSRGARQLLVSSPPRRMAMHDWWVYLVAAAFGELRYDERPTVKYRQHGGNAVGVATSPAEDLRRRLVRFFRRQGGVFGVSCQAAEFLHCFGDRLSADQRALTEALVRAKTDTWQRWRLVFGPHLFRQSRVDSAILRVLLAINRF